jgi:hypothetical protein
MPKKKPKNPIDVLAKEGKALEKNINRSFGLKKRKK